MGACRETLNIFYYIRNGKWKKVWEIMKHFDKLAFEDSFMPVVCKFKGHDLDIWDFNDWIWQGNIPCKRCHNFVDDYVKKKFHPNECLHKFANGFDGRLAIYIEIKMKTKVEVSFEGSCIKFSWRQNGSDGIDVNEGKKIKSLKNNIRSYLGVRFVKFYHGQDIQSVFFRY